jgi:hypothetical protein
MLFKALARLFILILNNVTERILPWGNSVRVNSTYSDIQEQEMGVPPGKYPLCYII